MANLLGYEDSYKRIAVEQFIHRYYQTVLALRELNDVLLQFLDEVILRRDNSDAVIPISERFQLRCSYIEVRYTDVFSENTSSLLEVFCSRCQRSCSFGSTRFHNAFNPRESRHLIDQTFRNDPNNCQLFLALLRSPHNLVTHLRRMKRYGSLGAYLPEFGRIIG